MKQRTENIELKDGIHSFFLNLRGTTDAIRFELDSGGKSVKNTHYRQARPLKRNRKWK